MKENELIGMKNKIASLTNIVQYLLQENQNIKTLASGTFETIRFMPDYDAAVAKLAEKVKESAEARPTFETIRFMPDYDEAVAKLAEKVKEGAEARPENIEVVDEEIVTPKLEID